MRLIISLSCLLIATTVVADGALLSIPESQRARADSAMTMTQDASEAPAAAVKPDQLSADTAGPVTQQSPAGTTPKETGDRSTTPPDQPAIDGDSKPQRTQRAPRLSGDAARQTNRSGAAATAASSEGSASAHTAQDRMPGEAGATVDRNTNAGVATRRSAESESDAAAGAVAGDAQQSAAAITESQAAEPDRLAAFCSLIDTKLTSIAYDECIGIGLVDSGALSNDETPLYYRDFVPATGEPVARVLLIGGIHGDEYSSVSVVFKWLGILQQDLGENFHWRIVPVANPDGLLRPPRMSQRMNSNGVDLNRNFPTPNWDTEAHDYWIKNARRNKRRYPGPAALSEPESAWLAEQIEGFQPHAVISVHAPHGVVDFDGPRLPPRQLGPLELRLLGTYPGSMGRYIGVHKGIPILTVELESAFGMPRRTELLDIWYDMIGWLHEKIARPMQLAKEEVPEVPATELMRVSPDSDNDG